MSPSCAILLVVCCALSALTKAQMNPGVVVRLSQSALDYTAQRAIRLLSDHVKNGAGIPDASGSSGKTSYSLTKMRVKDFNPPRSTVTVHNGIGVNWSLRNADISIGGDWRYRTKKLFIRISDHGSFTMSLSDVSIDIRVSLGLAANGRPTISMLACSSSIGRAQARFRGSIVSWLYNILYRFVEGKVKHAISDALCKAVKRTVETDGTRELANLQTEFRIQNTFTLDYSLVQNPHFGNNYIESSHKGQFRWAGDPHVPPLHPSPMQRQPSSSMVAIHVSDYVINTLAHVMQRHDQLSYTFTKTNLPASSRNVLDMTCTQFCLGKVFQSVAATYPQSSAKLITNVVRPPTIHVSSGTVLIRFDAEMKVAVSDVDNGRPVDLVNVLFRGFVHGSASIENDKIVGRVINASVAIVNTTILLPGASRTIPDGVLSFLNSMIQIYSQARIVPQLNRVAAIGFQLPKLKDINFVRPQLKLREGFFLVETDVAYN